jgi:hypothetical protein
MADDGIDSDSNGEMKIIMITIFFIYIRNNQKCYSPCICPLIDTRKAAGKCSHHTNLHSRHLEMEQFIGIILMIIISQCNIAIRQVRNIG